MPIISLSLQNRPESNNDNHKNNEPSWLKEKRKIQQAFAPTKFNTGKRPMTTERHLELLEFARVLAFGSVAELESIANDALMMSNDEYQEVKKLRDELKAASHSFVAPERLVEMERKNLVYCTDCWHPLVKISDSVGYCQPCEKRWTL